MVMYEEETAMRNYEKQLEDLAPPITFRMKTDRCVEIMREGEVIGHIFYELTPGNLSYSGKRSIQLCGFDTIAGIWGCGCFKGKNDLCVEFHWKPEKCPSHTMVEIGKVKDEVSGIERTVKKCWHCGKLELM